MFISKLQNLSYYKIPVTRKIHSNVIFLLSKFQCEGLAIKRSQNAKKISRKCKEYKEKLAKCPKPTYEQLCCKKLFPKPEPKCKINVIESYQKVYEDITNQTKSILNGIEEESKSILNRLKNDIEIVKSDEEAQLQEFSHKIMQRLEKLATLDPSSVSIKRRTALSLNYQTRQAFNNVQRDVIPKAERIKEILKILEQDVLTCIDRARFLIAFCRNCKNPQTLNKCIEENANTAKQILNETYESMQISLHKVEALQRETLGYHKTNIAEATEIHYKKYEAFLEHLDKCIFAIRNKNKATN